MSEKIELAESTRAQWKTYSNSFAKVLGKRNTGWRLNHESLQQWTLADGTLPPKKFMTDENIRRFLAA